MIKQFAAIAIFALMCSTEANAGNTNNGLISGTDNNDTFNSNTNSNNTNIGTDNGNTGGSVSIAKGAVQNTNNNYASGGSVKNSGNSTVHNSNSQYQGQGQSQSNSLRNSNANSAATSNTGGNSSNSYTTNSSRIPVNTAWAAPLTTSDDTCMGSSSLGGGVAVVSLSGATTWVSDNCNRRHDAVVMYNMGLKKAAILRMCDDEKNRAVIEASGEASCGGTKTNSRHVAYREGTDEGEDTITSYKSVNENHDAYLAATGGMYPSSSGHFSH